MMKHSLPQLRSALVTRPRLLARLDAAVQHPLTLIAAPAGFGKTTLLADWLAQTSDPATGRQAVGGEHHRLSVAWLALDNGDNDPVRLLRGLIAALQQIAPQLGVAVLPVLEQHRRADLPAVLQSLMRELAALPQPLVLILDDTHLLTDPAATILLTALVEQQPHTLRLILAGRADPPLRLARLRAHGQLHEIRAADLCFSPEECLTLLQLLTGRALTPAQVAPLCARTEGWAAGLQLAALTLQGTNQLAERLAAFNGTHRFVLDYLTDEVLAQQPLAIQQFLLATSILDRFSAELCAALLGEEDALMVVDICAQLDDVANANLFLIPLDDGQCWYRYHHLFADLLRHRLREHFPERVPLLHERAARWYAAKGIIDEAVQHALLAGATELAATLIEQAGRSRLAHGELATIQRWLAALPPGLIAARPSLFLLQAWSLAWDYQPAAVDAALRQLPPDPAAELAAEVAALHAFVARCQDDWPRAVQLSEQALRATVDNPFLAGFVYAGLGDVYWLTERAAQAMDCYRCALECACQSGDLVQLVDATHSLAQFELLQGRLAAAEAVYAYSTTRLLAHGALAAPFAQIFALGRASIHYERYDLAAARQAAEDGLVQMARCGLSAYAPFVQAELARIAAAQGDTASAQRALLAMRQGAQRMVARSGGQVPTWVGILRLRDVEITLTLGDLRAAARWAVDHWSAPTAEGSVVTIVQQYALAQVCVACGTQPALLAPVVQQAGVPLTRLAEQLIASCLQRFSAWGLNALVLELHTLEIHDYEPTPSDIVRAQNADLILNNGLGLERWFEKFMGALKDVPAVDVSAGVTPIPIAEGPYQDKPNPHAWMSLANAKIYVENIRKAFVELDPANAATYNANAAAYIAKFAPLGDQLTQTLAAIPEGERGLVTCEGAFSYFARDAGLKEVYMWAINADQEGTPDQVKHVIEQVRANNIPIVFCESTVNAKAMEQVASETGALFGGTLYVDSLTAFDGEAPTYLDMLKFNVDAIVNNYGRLR